MCKSDDETKNFFSFMRHEKEILGDSSLSLSLSAAKEAKEAKRKVKKRRRRRRRRKMTKEIKICETYHHK